MRVIFNLGLFMALFLFSNFLSAAVSRFYHPDICNSSIPDASIVSLGFSFSSFANANYRNYQCFGTSLDLEPGDCDYTSASVYVNSDETDYIVAYYACRVSQDWLLFDTDGDGVINRDDGAPYDSSSSVAPVTNGSQDLDSDLDGIPDLTDNCPLTINPDQLDTDGNGVGDACEDAPLPDSDLDGIPDSTDNCPDISNFDQLDFDGDGIGDVCDANCDTSNLNITVDGLNWLPTLPNSLCDGICNFTLDSNPCGSGQCTANYSSSYAGSGSECSVNELASINFNDYVETAIDGGGDVSGGQFNYDVDNLLIPSIQGSVISGNSGARTDQCFRIVNCSAVSFKTVEITTASLLSNSCPPFDPSSNLSVSDVDAYAYQILQTMEGSGSHPFMPPRSFPAYKTNFIFNMSSNAGSDGNEGTYSYTVGNLYYDIKVQGDQDYPYHVNSSSHHFSGVPAFLDITLQGCGFNDVDSPSGNGTDSGVLSDIFDLLKSTGLGEDFETNKAETDVSIESINDSLLDQEQNTLDNIQYYQDMDNSVVGEGPSSINDVISALSPSGGSCPSDILTHKGQSNLLFKFCDVWDNQGGRSTVGWIFYILTSVGIFIIWTSSSSKI